MDIGSLLLLPRGRRRARYTPRTAERMCRRMAGGKATSSGTAKAPSATAS